MNAVLRWRGCGARSGRAGAAQWWHGRCAAGRAHPGPGPGQRRGPGTRGPAGRGAPARPGTPRAAALTRWRSPPRAQRRRCWCAPTCKGWRCSCLPRWTNRPTAPCRCWCAIPRRMPSAPSCRCVAGACPTALPAQPRQRWCGQRLRDLGCGRSLPPENTPPRWSPQVRLPQLDLDAWMEVLGHGAGTVPGGLGPRAQRQHPATSSPPAPSACCWDVQDCASTSALGAQQRQLSQKDGLWAGPAAHAQFAGDVDNPTCPGALPQWSGVCALAAPALAPKSASGAAGPADRTGRTDRDAQPVAHAGHPGTRFPLGRQSPGAAHPVGAPAPMPRGATGRWSAFSCSPPTPAGAPRANGARPARAAALRPARASRWTPAMPGPCSPTWTCPVCWHGPGQPARPGAVARQPDSAALARRARATPHGHGPGPVSQG